MLGRRSLGKGSIHDVMLRHIAEVKVKAPFLNSKRLISKEANK